MVSINEKTGDTIDAVTPVSEAPQRDSFDEKVSIDEVARQLNATPEEVLEARELSRALSLEEVKESAERLVNQHGLDPNFPAGALERLKEFLANDDAFTNPDSHSREISEAKIEVALLTNNSPYAEVRAVVDPHDDPSMPVATIRAWTIGLFFVVFIAFINQLFSVRQPSITLRAEVVQLLAYPVGKAAEKWLPDIGFTLFGIRHSLNPGPFNKKEHMLISIMASVGKTLPSSKYIIFTQWMDRYFGQKYAKPFSYQILLALSTNLMGFGLAGLCRRFLVYPSFCLWPASLVTIALNSSLHNEANHPVPGPFKKIYNMSRYRFFMAAFGAMFVWFWFPDYIFGALSLFNWIAWIAPNNFTLAAITGVNKGLGFNPIPTFDWNVATHVVQPLVVPFRVTLNTFIGVFLGGITIIGLYWTNAYNTAYLPINSNLMYNHFGGSYNVSKILDGRGWLDEAKYQTYSPVYLAASSITMYYYFFAVYAATVSYAILYHRHDIALGFRSLWCSFRKEASSDFKDVHTRLMSNYSEVPEWWYLILNLAAIAFGVAAVAAWSTETSVGVVFFGIALALVFVIPTGIIFATTGMEVEFNVLAEFIGGAWEPGNALAMNFFKCFGYVTTAHALDFANDLKLAHYLKIPQRHTFAAQVVAVFVSAFVCTGVMNFQISNIPDLCSTNQKDRFTCPGVNTYFTAAVLFGSLGAKKVFGSGGIYTALLSAFPVGFALPFIFYYFQRKFPRTHWFAKIHPVMILSGGISWSPYNIAYMWPAVLPGWLSMVYLRQRYLAFWSKYNYVLSAAFSTAIAIAGVIIFFAVSYHGFEINWWGNDSESGCESTACTLLKLPKGEARRAKCDEARPACRRCSITGKVCDGYGGEGGGGSAARRPSLLLMQTSSPPRCDTHAGLAGLSSTGRLHFEWFVNRTMSQLPGVFNSPFWKTMVLQSSSTEPAILYAILALSAAHETASTETCIIKREPSSSPPTDSQEHLSLQYYNKSIYYLQKHLRIPSTESIRIVLVVCTVYVCLEFMERRYKRGFVHFKHSLHLLESLLKSAAPSSSGDPVDEWFVDVIPRLDIQATLLTNEFYQGSGTKHSSIWPPLPQLFQSIRDASQSLDGLLVRAYQLQKDGAATGPAEDAADIFELLATQQTLRNDLESWIQAFDVFKARTWNFVTDRERIAYGPLPIYHTMAYVITNTSLNPGNELIFDLYTSHFASVVSSARSTLDAASSTSLPTPAADSSPEDCKHQTEHAFETGLVPPLFFTAVKCRVPRIRRQSLELLLASQRQEGIWDAVLSARIAKEVMILEERGLYEGDIDEKRESPDFVIPILPGPPRIHKLWIELPEEPPGDILLSIQRILPGGKRETLARKFHAENGFWTSIPLTLRVAKATELAK
ncbi:OPT oligopeptide transporter [Colletotrichum orchidophilum]|uniref:OPT oligopeptide transporter n=1 Tax=Colletotrichum orchidophilum TaxID=1209926 RepID=A0A1G4BR64_9PEZI|nr:OPT oligopeptide transporter [Colletotrichum orchidophilum]OHF03932.1 OPT oligopeptide transporter [Colletotrichum orchidophilum]